MASPLAIMVHGGAGPIYADDRARACAEGCLRAAETGYSILRAGGSALEAVEQAGRVLEDNPLFNAGTGSTLNADGELEMDALLMEGEHLRAGGVSMLRGFRNPLAIARAVLEHSPHVLLGGQGAARFAREQGFQPSPPAELTTPRALNRWHKEREEGWSRRPGTIGAVAVDARGHVAAATSTGGISGKYQGRIGDTPLIGCGTFADSQQGAASATGHGESIARIVMAKVACSRLAAGELPDAAARAAVAELDRVAGEAGLILVDPHGRLGHAYNTERMSRAWIDSNGRSGCAFDGPVDL